MKYWNELTKKLTPYVPGEQLNEKNIIKLNTNENPFPPSPKVMEEVIGGIGKELKKYPDPESLKLRDSIANYYNIKRNNVFIGNGSDEVLAHIFMGFFKGKRLFFPNLSYSFYPVYSNLYEIEYQKIALDEKFEINTEDYKELDGNIIFPNPNAPTGIELGFEKIEEIINSNPNNLVVIDEAYVDFGGKSTVELIGKYKNLLVVQTMSKSRSLVGMRVGFAMGDDELIEGLTRVKNSFNSYPIDRLAQLAGAAAMEDIDYFEYTCKEIIENRNWTSVELKKRGFEVLPSKTNFIFVKIDKAEEIYLGLKDKKILVRHFKDELIADYLRISIGTKGEMKKLIQGIDDLRGGQ